jgi:phosphoglycerol transferase MdoB-like AlkP superfamily enzyme
MPRLKLKAFSDSLFALLKKFSSASGSSFAFFVFTLILTLAYRVQLTIQVYLSPVRPYDFDPGGHPLWFFFRYLPYDFSFVLSCFLVFWLLTGLRVFMNPGKGYRLVKIAGFVWLHLVLAGLLFVHASHLQLLFAAQTGLSLSSMMEVFSEVSLTESAKFVNLEEVTSLLFSVALFWLVFLSTHKVKLRIAKISLLAVIFFCLISSFSPKDKNKPVPAEIRLNPVLFLISDIVDHARYTLFSKTRNANATGEGELGILQFRNTGAVRIQGNSSPSAPNTRPWNVIFFIMESVGARYAFNTDHGRSMPMPFLHRLSKEGWHLKKHYATSNFSTKAVFSILSGLYDFFERKPLGVRPEVQVPSIHTFLSGSHDSFLVTPSSLSWYFPAAFVKNSGLIELHSYETLDFKIKEEFHSLGHYIARDEVQAVDRFIQRLDKAREPFLGIYVSFAAHFPYFDYGPDYRIREEDGRLISRYENNLNLLDRMIKRIYDHLQSRGQLNRTLFVIVGDHGQAFGQHHPDNYMHYRYSYNENLETPAILYQPGLFRPKAIGFSTSHVDLLPTVLDALGIPYDASVLDGRSLFHHSPGKRTIFFYGYEGSISSIDANQIKVQYSLKKNTCSAFDLKLDPDEKNPLDCNAYPLRLEDLRRYTFNHDSSLVQYNEFMAQKKEHQGQ